MFFSRAKPPLFLFYWDAYCSWSTTMQYLLDWGGERVREYEKADVIITDEGSAQAFSFLSFLSYTGLFLTVSDLIRMSQDEFFERLRESKLPLKDEERLFQDMRLLLSEEASNQQFFQIQKSFWELRKSKQSDLYRTYLSEHMLDRKANQARLKLNATNYPLSTKYDWDVSTDWRNILYHMRFYEGVKSLILDGFNDYAQVILGQFPSCEELELRNCGIGNNLNVSLDSYYCGFYELSSLQNLPLLKRLKIKPLPHCITLDGAKSFSTLEELVVHKSQLSSICWEETLPKLRLFELSQHDHNRFDFSSKGFRIVWKAPMPELKTFRLRGVFDTEVDFSFLEQAPNLESLLIHTRHWQKSLEQVLPKLKKLQNISLKYGVFENITFLLPCEQLQVLELHNCDFASLQGIEALPRLRRIRLHRCSYIPELFLTQLQSRVQLEISQ